MLNKYSVNVIMYTCSLDEQTMGEGCSMGYVFKSKEEAVDQFNFLYTKLLYGMGNDKVFKKDEKFCFRKKYEDYYKYWYVVIIQLN